MTSDSWRPMNPDDLERVERRIPATVAEWMDIRWMDFRRCRVLAGGFIRDTLANGQSSDIDLYIGSGAVLPNPCELPIQMIHTGPWPLSFVESTFGPTVCCAAMWRDMGTWKGLMHPDFRKDLDERRLRMRNTRSERPEHFLKLMRKGYRPEREDVVRMLDGLYDESLAHYLREALNIGGKDYAEFPAPSADDLEAALIMYRLGQDDPGEYTEWSGDILSVTTVPAL